MQVTINVGMLIDLVLIMVLGLSFGFMLYAKWRAHKSLLDLRAVFEGTPAAVRSTVRHQTLFMRPLSEHRRQHPNDLKCALLLLQPANGDDPSLSWYNQNGNVQEHGWDNPAGRDVVELLRDGIASMERERPGLIRMLQPMLDVAADEVRQGDRP